MIALKKWPSHAEIELLITIFWEVFGEGGYNISPSWDKSWNNGKPLNKTHSFKVTGKLSSPQVFCPLRSDDSHGETHQRPLRGARFASKAAAGSPAEPHRAVAKSPDCHWGGCSNKAQKRLGSQGASKPNNAKMTCATILAGIVRFIPSRYACRALLETWCELKCWTSFSIATGIDKRSLALPFQMLRATCCSSRTLQKRLKQTEGKS